MFSVGVEGTVYHCFWRRLRRGLYFAFVLTFALRWCLLCVGVCLALALHCICVSLRGAIRQFLYLLLIFTA